MAKTPGRLRPFILLLSMVAASGFAQETPAWKHRVVFPNDPLERREWVGGTNMGWIKFTLDLARITGDPLFFQDSRAYDLHYDFVSRHLDPYQGIAPEEFNRISLFAAGQQLALGAVLTPPQGYPLNQPIQEFGIQLVRQDPYTREEVAALFFQVREAVASDEAVVAYYMPTLEQADAAREHETWFAEQGIPLASPERWVRGNVIYSRGWALGRCTYVPVDQIEQAYLEGRLRPEDILLTDAVPAEVPVLAGIISLSASTPNSHVAILANTFAIPFVYLAEERDAERAQSLTGHTIVLRATPARAWDNDVRLIDAQGALSDEQAAELLALKQPPVLKIQPIQRAGSYSRNTEALVPGDIATVGGKAAHFGILRRAIPDHSPPAAAFTFDLWLDFLEQPLASGRRLREEIDGRLQGFTYPPSDMAALAYALGGIRDLFKDDTQTAFSESARQAVLHALQDPQYGFDPERKIRFRSSTNMEDSEAFTGAGLYDSYSGCLADDLDGDDSGPSLCDPNRSKERGVFRAIRKVFASFYNHNAYVERLRHGIDERDVGMALLVHHSFPDAIEWANGVATYLRGQSFTELALVSQIGAVSVANPEPGVLPEQVHLNYSDPHRLHPRLSQYSNLVPLGQTVMTWSEDYEVLTQLLQRSAEEYQRVTGQPQPVLDFEYKRVAPAGKLVVKQIRPLPIPQSDRRWASFLISEPVDLRTFQGEYGDVIANHRLKSEWAMNCASGWIDQNSLADTFYRNVDLTYQDEGRVQTLQGSMAELPGAWHRVHDPDARGFFTVEDGWRLEDLPVPREWILRSERIPATVPVTDCPVITLRDFSFELVCVYDRHVPGFDFQSAPCELGRIREESIRLEPRPDPDPDDLRRERVIADGEITIVTEFDWPPHPTGPTAGYTAPLARWHRTTLSGLTPTPIVLTHPFAQTYQPGHHNFWENFLFEPRLDPQVSPEALAALDALGIVQIHAYSAQRDSWICLFGSD
jgi:hypothetical protein